MHQLNKWYLLPLFIIALTFFSLVVVPGYESFTADQPSFLPPLFHKLDPSLFPNDLSWFAVMHTERTFLTDFLAFFMQRGIDIFWLLFILSVFFRAIFFISLYYIIRFFTRNNFYALFSLLFFIAPFFVPGTRYMTMERVFSYRVIALPMSLAFLALHFHGWRFFSLIPLLFGFVIHPLTAAPFFAFYYAHTSWELWRERRNVRSSVKHLLIAFIPILFIMLFLFYKNSAVKEQFFIFMDKEWKYLAYGRNNPAFFTFWSIQQWISLASWVLLSSISVLFLKKFIPEKQNREMIYLLLGVSIALLLVAAIGEYTMLHGIIKFHFQRGLLLMTLFTPIITGAFAFWYAEYQRMSLFKNGLLFSLLFWFVMKENFVFLREQMLFFIPSLCILFLSEEIPIIHRYRTLATLAAMGMLGVGFGFATARAIIYSDIRSLIVFYLILFAGFAFAFLYRRRAVLSDTVIKFGVIAALPILLITSLFYLRGFTIYPPFSYDKPYMEACDWITHYTQKDDVFIVEPFAFVGGEPNQFRLACFRPIFTTLKDSAPPYEPRERTFDWKRRQDLVHALPDNWQLLKMIKNNYRVDYIFSEQRLPIEHTYPLVFANNRFFIYHLR